MFYEKIFFIFTALICVLFQSCDTSVNQTNALDFENKINVGTVETPSIIGKWYYNSEDDRYYYQFISNGTVYYQYYQNIGSETSALNTFITKIGNWSYLNIEKNSFSISWDDSIACWYDIISEDNEKLVVKRREDGPVGLGLGDVTNLLKSAKTVVYTVDEEIKGLIGTWYYDETKNGKSIKFQVDGICYCKYYQNYGSGTFSNLNGWVTRKGVWHYSKENKLLSITMNSEISYYYDISDLSSTTVTLKLPSDSPAGTSIVYSANPLYK